MSRPRYRERGSEDNDGYQTVSILSEIKDDGKIVQVSVKDTGPGSILEI